jgi:hypothetical protein
MQNGIHGCYNDELVDVRVLVTCEREEKLDATLHASRLSRVVE